jgi:hypothetical protein
MSLLNDSLDPAARVSAVVGVRLTARYSASSPYGKKVEIVGSAVRL